MDAEQQPSAEIRSRRCPRPIVAAVLLAAVVGLGAGSAPVAAQTADQPPKEAPGEVWRLVRTGGGLTSPRGTTGAGLHGVASDGDRFVVVGDEGTIAHSSDGNRWVEASSNPDVGWLTDVAWGGSRFVAVGDYTIVHSRDGERWQSARRSDWNLASIAWGNRRFVAVGDGGSVAHSADGVRWRRARQSATHADLRGIAWGGDRFVAVGGDGTIVHSADGDRWQPASRPAVPFRAAQPGDDPHQIYYYFGGVAWSGERFVAVGWGGNDHLGTVVHSADGDHWELAADHEYLADEHFEAVAWSGERYVTISYFDGIIMHSADGDRWEPARETVTVNLLRSVTWGNGRFVAVGENGTIVASP